MLPPSSLVLSQGWGLIDLPLRASNEGLLRPRVARAQKIIRLHPLLCCGSKGSARVSFHPFTVRVLRARRKFWLLPIPPFRGRAFSDTNDPIELTHFSLKGVAWISPQLRTSGKSPYAPSRAAWSILKCARRTSTF